MAQISPNDIKPGTKLEIDSQPWTVVSAQFVKPGKGQAFVRVKAKNLTTGRVVERTHRTNEKLDLADVEESTMRLLYTDGQDGVFMNDQTYDQINIPLTQLPKEWLKDDTLYDIIIYKGSPITVEPPTFMELTLTECDPAVRGDTASGRVLKPAVTETGAKVQVPIFIDQGEVCRFDTRTGEYVSRAN